MLVVGAVVAAATTVGVAAVETTIEGVGTGPPAVDLGPALPPIVGVDRKKAIGHVQNATTVTSPEELSAIVARRLNLVMVAVVLAVATAVIDVVEIVAVMTGETATGGMTGGTIAEVVIGATIGEMTGEVVDLVVAVVAEVVATCETVTGPVPSAESITLPADQSALSVMPPNRHLPPLTKQCFSYQDWSHDILRASRTYYRCLGPAAWLIS